MHIKPRDFAGICKREGPSWKLFLEDLCDVVYKL